VFVGDGSFEKIGWKVEVIVLDKAKIERICGCGECPCMMDDGWWCFFPTPNNKKKPPTLGRFF